MSDTDDRRRAEAILASAEAFEERDRGYAVTTTSIESTVTVTDSPGEEGLVYRVTVVAPTIDAVVTGETVDHVIQTGWFETFERRLEDPHQVGVGLEPIQPTVVRDGDNVIVRMVYTSRNPQRAAENAKALAEFVEGTWMQGLIPGYGYREPASTLLERATRDYDGS